MRQTHASDRSTLHSLPAALGLPCALLSLASGLVSLVVAFLLWWQSAGESVQRIGQQAGLFSAALGLTLAGIGFAAPRRRVRGIAVVALFVNACIACLTLDGIFQVFR